MKSTRINKAFVLGLATFLLFFPYCTPDDDEKDDECATTEMNNVHIDVQPKLNVSASQLPENRNLKEAELLTFRGTIYKQYCNGNKSDPFSYNSSHDPRAIDMVYWTQGFFVGTIYGFELANVWDVLIINYELIATFPDGAKFSFSYHETGKFWEATYVARTIFWDDNAMKHYILCSTRESDTWLPYFGN